MQSQGPVGYGRVNSLYGREPHYPGETAKAEELFHREAEDTVGVCLPKRLLEKSRGKNTETEPRSKSTSSNRFYSSLFSSSVIYI